MTTYSFFIDGVLESSDLTLAEVGKALAKARAMERFGEQGFHWFAGKEVPYLKEGGSVDRKEDWGKKYQVQLWIGRNSKNIDFQNSICLHSEDTLERLWTKFVGASTSNSNLVVLTSEEANLAIAEGHFVDDPIARKANCAVKKATKDWIRGDAPFLVLTA